MIEDKLAREAAEKGLILIGAYDNPAYRMYRFKKCGHVVSLQTTNVRNSKCSCAKCLTIKLNREAASVGLVMTGKGTHYSNRTYKRIKCGHEVVIRTDKVRTNTFQCKECLFNKHKREALEHGVELLGVAPQGIHRIYKLPCGHEKKILTSHLREDRFKCKDCYEDSLLSGLRLANASLLKKTGRGNCFLRFNKCGHERTARMNRVIEGKIYCGECNNSYLHLKSNIYLISITVGGFTWLKLGYAKINKERFRSYGLPDGAEVEVVCTRQFETGKDARKKEESIHNVFSSKKLTPVEMQKYHRKSGFTECYPIDMVDTLKDAVLEC